MPSTRKRKAKEKRSRQSDVMPDNENLDVMLGNFQGNEQVRNEIMSDANFDLESRRLQREMNMSEGNFRSLLNANVSKNIEITAESSRAIIPVIFSQVYGKLEEMKTDLNSHILNIINSAIEQKVIPSIKYAVASQNSAGNAILDLRSDGPHPSTSN